MVPLALGVVGGGITDRLTLIEENILVGDATEILLTPTDINLHKMYLLIYGIENALDEPVIFYMTINGDNVLANYENQALDANGVACNAVRANDPTLYSAAALVECSGHATMVRSPQSLWRACCYHQYRGPADIGIQWRGIMKDAVVANVTSIRVWASVANGLNAGSFLQLYGYVVG